MSAAGRSAEAGFSLVAVVAGMTIMLILMGAAMPSWKYVMKNEREQELYFRGDQIAAAIERYQKKNGGTVPVSLEVLVKGRFLRKAYTDPMAKDGKWRFIRPGEVMVPRSAAMPGRPGASPSPIPSPAAGARSDVLGPFIGVASTSKEKSLRVMNGRNQYDEWLFVAGKPRVLGHGGPQPVDGNAGAQAPKGGKVPVVPGQTK